MKKTFLFPSLLILIPFFIALISFGAYQVFRHGLFDGLYLAALGWSMYVICIPAAHGRFLFGMPVLVFFKTKFFPEPHVWAGAVALNIVTMLFDPKLYQENIVTHLFYRILIMSKYWPILVIALVGTWYRVVCGYKRYYAHERYHTLVRYLILLAGLLLFFFLTKNDFIMLMNSVASG